MKNEDLPGLTRKGERIMDTVGEWKYLAELYAKAIIHQREELGQLRARINTLEQKLNNSRKKHENNESV